MEGIHTGFLWKITGKREWRLEDGTWETPGAEVVPEAAGMQLAMTYIGRRQVIVAQWGAIHSLCEVCARGKGYKGVGCRRDAWWRQEVT